MSQFPLGVWQANLGAIKIGNRYLIWDFKAEKTPDYPMLWEEFESRLANWISYIYIQTNSPEQQKQFAEIRHVLDTKGSYDFFGYPEFQQGLDAVVTPEKKEQLERWVRRMNRRMRRMKKPLATG